MKAESTPPSNWNSIKTDMFDAFEHLEIIQMQSMNLFNKPQVSQRVLDLVKVLEGKSKDLSHLISNPTPDDERLLQELFFNLKKIKDVTGDLKINPLELKNQQAFMNAKDHIRKCLDQIFL